MLHFECDYLEGAHPRILERLIETNLVQQVGYGEDEYCASAREKVRAACGCPDAAVYFIGGGTQANAVVIDALLARYQGVVAAQTGHINGHEAGAVESNGHKILTLPQAGGKISADDLLHFLEQFYADGNHPHMVHPGMVYISHPTEYGMLYTLKELQDLHKICRQYRIPLFIDGARLGYGLMANKTDLTLPLLAQNCDAFYIGGTKVGALCGEAIVFPNPELISCFFTVMKQHGAVLAKGRLYGVQFDTLFTDDLYFRIARHAIEMAEYLKEGLHRIGCRFFLETPTNQQFLIFQNSELEKLGEKAGFDIWEPFDETHKVVRFATSWATQKEQIDALLAAVAEVLHK